MAVILLVGLGSFPSSGNFFFVINELCTLCVFTYLHWYSFALFTIYLHFF